MRGSDDDLDRLAATFNRMLDRITLLMESLRQVSNDVAHDLRTPLTRLRQRLEASRTATTAPERVSAVAAALEEQAWATSGFDRVLILWRRNQIEAIMRFLREELTALAGPRRG